MPKKEYNKIKSMTEQQLIEFYNIEKEEGGYWYKGVYEYGLNLYEFGKYTDFKPPKKSLKPFFKNKELMEIYNEHDFYIVTKDFLEYVIENYKKRITDYYNDMMFPFFGEKDNPTNFLNSIKRDCYPDNNITFDFTKITQEEQNALFKIFEHVRSMRTEWTCLTPFNLKNGSDEITTSWMYEYSIFELVRIYKSFDWKTNVMIYYGY
jgi:hypothetical protein